MKTTILFFTAVLLTGCAHRATNDQGRPAEARGLETGTHVDSELPYRRGPGLNTTDREIPRRNGPGELGTPPH